MTEQRAFVHLKQNACFTLESRARGAPTTSHFKAQPALLADGQAGGAGTAPRRPCPLSCAARAGLLGAAPPMLDRLRCPSCFFYTVSTDTGSSQMCGGRGPFPPLLRPGSCVGAELFPPKPSHLHFGRQSRFPFPPPRNARVEAGGGRGPAGPTPGALRGDQRPLPTAAPPPGRARAGRPPGAGARGSSGRAPAGPRRRLVCPRNPALKPGFAPGLLFNTSQKMRLLLSGDVAACLPAPLGEQGRTRSGHCQLPWSSLLPWL